MLSAGEASGDLHGAGLCRELMRLQPGLRLAGMGGALMAAAGMEQVVDSTRLAVVGGSEALGRLPALWRAYRALTGELAARRPRALVVIDFPEFNFRLARMAHRAGVPVVYFIPPQLWAWRRSRVRIMARLVTRVLAVFPFEPPIYERAAIPVEFVGHPLLDAIPAGLDRSEARRRLGLGQGADEAPVVALLPGSRREEVERLLPVMLDAAARLQAAAPSPTFLLALAPSADRGRIETAIAARGPGAPALRILEQRTYEAMAAADVVLVASGTATLETALLGAPMVVCYRASRLTWIGARMLVRIPWISLPNIVAGRALVPEVLQGALSGERLAAEARRLLESAAAAQAQRAAFAELRGALGAPGVAARAARAVLGAARAA
jgi:lipid-A-disaccharide synthase